MVVTADGDEVSLWLVDLAGDPCGAWVVLASTPEDARRILSLCDRRALITVEPGTDIDMMLRLAKTSQVDISRSALEARICSIPEALAATASARCLHTEAVHAVEQRERKTLAPLRWERPVPNPVPNSVEHLAKAAAIRTMSDGASAALTVSRLARWSIRLWTDTEGVRARRKHLRAQFGPTQSLPKPWREAVKAAYQTPFAL